MKSTDTIINSITITTFSNSLKFLLPEIFLTGIILFVILLSVILEKRYSFSTRKVLFFNIGLAIVALGVVQFLLFEGVDSLTLTGKEVLEPAGDTGISFKYNKGTEVKLINNSYRTSPLILTIKSIVNFFSILCLYVVWVYAKDEKNLIKYEYVSLILFSTLSLFIILSSNDFLVFFMGLELLSFSLYVLASFKKNKNFSTEAGLKYFIIGGVSSAILLFGISLIYGYTGLINFDDIAESLKYYGQPNSQSTDISYSEARMVLIGFILVTISLLIKLGAAPFHSWVPDVYEGVMTPVTVYLSTVPKIVIYFILFKFYLYVFSHFIIMGSLNIIVVGVFASLTLGA